MLFSRDWLADYVELGDDAGELADRLTAAGLAVEGVEEAGGDVILDVDVTTNRPDCMNHLGLAREAAVLYGKPLRPPEVEIEEAAEPASDAARLVIEDFALCPRYDALVIRNVRVGPSPDWLVRRLESIGARSINNVVDVTNFVLWETGQPLHAFDLDRLGNEVRVRPARPGEKLTTLDGEDRELDPEILVIADAQRAVALAGIMGGLDTEVTADTRHVLLESAHFDPKAVQRGAKRLGLHTDASHRFERGADPEACLWAARRAAALIVDVAGGEVLAGALEEKRLRTDWPPALDLEQALLNRFGGVAIAAPEVEATLAGLGFAAAPRGGGEAWRVTVPSWRYYDFEHPYVADLYEEVLRIHGFEDVPSTLPQIGGADAPARPEHRRAGQVRDLLAASGYAEAITFSFTARAADAAVASLYGDRPPLALANPLSDRYAVLQRSLLPSLVDSARYNQRRGAPAVRLFEVGHVFCDDGAGGKLEMETVALVAGGRLGTPWERAHAIGFYDVKGTVEALAAALGVELEARTASVHGLSSGAAAELRVAGGGSSGGERAVGDDRAVGEDRVVGHLGQLADADGPYPLYVAELALEWIGAGDSDLEVQPPSKYPAITVDTTLTHAADVSWAEIAGAVAASAVADLKEFGLKDRYRGQGVPEGAVNSTLYFLYNSNDRSLTSEDVHERHQRLAAKLEETFGLAAG